MIIGAISDLDVLGMDLEPFWHVLKSNKQPDLLLFAGDMYEFHIPENYETIMEFLKMVGWKCPIIGVFGNKVFDEELDIINKAVKDRITFLDNESTVLDIKDKKVGIVGSRGVVDAPTWFVFQNLPDIKDLSGKDIEPIDDMLKKLDCDIKILLTHYSPTYKTLKGERKDLYPHMGSEKLEKVLMNTNTSFAIHGHAHYGIPISFIGSIPVFNVCFSVNRDIVKIDTENLPKAKE